MRSIVGCYRDMIQDDILNRIEDRCIGCVTGSGNNLRFPTGKGIYPFVGTLLIYIRVRGRRAVFHCRLVDLRLIVIKPCDGECILGCRERSLVGGIFGYCHYCRTPASEGVGELLGSLLGRFSASRLNAILKLTALQFRTILIEEGDGIFVFRCLEGSFVRSVCRHGCDSRSPACKSIRIFSRIVHTQVSVLRRCTIF